MYADVIIDSYYKYERVRYKRSGPGVGCGHRDEVRRRVAGRSGAVVDGGAEVEAVA